MCPIRALIVDDEAPAREELLFLLGQFHEIHVSWQADNGIDALAFLKANPVDLVFLDIQIPGIHGINLASEISLMESPPLVVFITAHDAYAVKAFDMEALDYLLKPIAPERLTLTIKRVKEKLAGKERGDSLYARYLKGLKEFLEEYARKEESRPSFDSDDESREGGSPASSQFLTIYTGGRYCPLFFRDIACLKAEGGATRIYSDRGESLIHRPLHEYEDLLPSDQFFHCHRSYIVNMHFIEHIDLWFSGTYQMEVRHVPDPVPVSRGRTRELKDRVNMQ